MWELITDPTVEAKRMQIDLASLVDESLEHRARSTPTNDRILRNRHVLCSDGNASEKLSCEIVGVCTPTTARRLRHPAITNTATGRGRHRQTQLTSRSPLHH